MPERTLADPRATSDQALFNEFFRPGWEELCEENCGIDVFYQPPRPRRVYWNWNPPIRPQVRNLPNNLWAHILDWVIELYVGTSTHGTIDRVCPEANWAPVRFAQVCQDFRRAAFSRPDLFSTICIGREASGHFTSPYLVDHMVRRASRASHLTIILDGGPGIRKTSVERLDSCLVTAARNIKQWRKLVVWGEWTADITPNLLKYSGIAFELKHITIEGRGDPNEITPFITDMVKASRWLAKVKWLNVVDKPHKHSSGHALYQQPWLEAFDQLRDLELSCPMDITDTWYLLSASARRLQIFKLNSLLIDPDRNARSVTMRRPHLPATIVLPELALLKLSVDFDYFDRRKNHGSPICQLLSRLYTPKLNTLHLGYDTCWQPNLFGVFTATCPRVESLTLDTVSVDSAGLTRTLNAFPRLRKLEIHTGKELRASITRNTLEAMTPEDGRQAELVPKLREAILDDHTIHPNDLSTFVRMVRKRCTREPGSWFRFAFVRPKRSRDIVLAMYQLHLPNLRTRSS